MRSLSYTLGCSSTVCTLVDTWRYTTQDTSSASDSIKHDIGKPPFDGPYSTYDPANWERWVKPLPELLDTDEDFTEYDTYYFVGISLERMDERSHHANTSSQVRDTCNSRVSDLLRGTFKEGSELLFHFCHSPHCQGITGDPFLTVLSETPVPNPNGIAGPNLIATQTEGEVMENDIPRDSEEDRSVSGDVDESAQEQVQPPISPSAKPEMDLSALA